MDNDNLDMHVKASGTVCSKSIDMLGFPHRPRTAVRVVKVSHVGPSAAHLSKDLSN